jgi:mono/diheme cytochrome c family protein
MSKKQPETREPQTLGVLAQYAGPEELTAAARNLTDQGYKKVEAFSPFPIHGIDEALKAPAPLLPWVVLGAGLTGLVVALGMQYYMNAAPENAQLFGYYSPYQYRISGKPYFSLPANIPVAFELIILFSALTTFFGMLVFNKLPTLSNPLFRSGRFRKATDNGFFLYVDAKDPKFAVSGATSALNTAGAMAVETIEEEATGHTLPGMIHWVGALSTAAALLPPLWMAAAATRPSATPRYSIFWDMDYQDKFKPQTQTTLFADGRAARPHVPGTIGRGGMRDDTRMYLGIEPDEAVAGSRQQIEALLASYNAQPDASAADGEEEETEESADAEDSAEEESASDEPVAPAAAATPPVDPTAPPEPNWVTLPPMPATEAMMDRGQQRFNIYCAACHGRGGFGDGLIAQRALQLQQPTWVPPTNIHTEYVTQQPIGKVFNTISNGIRKMPGYKEQISVEDRWAISLYVQALQREQTAKEADVPAETLQQLRRQK